MYMCSMCMLNDAANANRSRTVVLSAIYVVVFLGQSVFEVSSCPLWQSTLLFSKQFPLFVAFLPIPHREWDWFGVFRIFCEGVHVTTLFLFRFSGSLLCAFPHSFASG